MCGMAQRWKNKAHLTHISLNPLESHKGLLGIWGKQLRGLCFISQIVASLDGSFRSDICGIKALVIPSSLFTGREHTWCVVSILSLYDPLASEVDKRESKGISIFCEVHLHFTERELFSLCLGKWKYSTVFRRHEKCKFMATWTLWRLFPLKQSITVSFC